MKNDTVYTLDYLHTALLQDPAYGAASKATPRLLSALYRENLENPQFNVFQRRYNTLPCKQDHQLHLLLLSCDLLGLPYRLPGSQRDRLNPDLLKHWNTPLEIRKSDLRHFLSARRWPLPAALFPEAELHTGKLGGLKQHEYDELAAAYFDHLPNLEQERDELYQVEPSTFDEYLTKFVELTRINGEVQAIEDRLGVDSNLRGGIAARDLRLQIAANHEAGAFLKEKGRIPTKGEIANRLSESGEWSDQKTSGEKPLSATAIARIIRNHWKNRLKKLGRNP